MSDSSIRIDGIPVPMKIPGKSKTRQIIEIAARFAGMSMGSYIRNCIVKDILAKHGVDISFVECKGLNSRGAPIPGSAAEIIQSIIDAE